MNFVFTAALTNQGKLFGETILTTEYRFQLLHLRRDTGQYFAVTNFRFVRLNAEDEEGCHGRNTTGSEHAATSVKTFQMEES